MVFAALQAPSSGVSLSAWLLALSCSAASIAPYFKDGNMLLACFYANTDPTSIVFCMVFYMHRIVCLRVLVQSAEPVEHFLGCCLVTTTYFFIIYRVSVFCRLRNTLNRASSIVLPTVGRRFLRWYQSGVFCRVASQSKMCLLGLDLTGPS